MREARVAADAIGSLAVYKTTALRSCAWNTLLTRILRRYAAPILFVYCYPRVTAATRASPEAKIQIALRADREILASQALRDDVTIASLRVSGD